ncbi:DUF3566 domain-containing protein [Jatrophihabitans fulvus]
MTHSPQTGQTAPRSNGYASSDTAAGSSGSWSGNGRSGGPVAHDPAFGGPVQADAPTGTMPALATGTAVSGSRADAPTTSTPSAGTSSASGKSSQGGGRSRNRGPRRARLQLRHINPWTVLKFSCVLSIALFFVWLITVGVLYGVLDAAGIVGKVNDVLATLNGDGSAFQLTPGLIFGGAAVIGVVNIVLFIALTTVGSIVYNLCADLVGGIEVTLSER